MDPRNRLIFALDVPNLTEAMRYAQMLAGRVGCLKVGLELFVREGPSVVRAIRDHSDADIFLDLKLHDIPATVHNAVRSAARHEVNYLTIHTSGGLEMLKAACSGAANSPLSLLGVTVLTSDSSADRGDSVSSLVEERVKLAKTAGCQGVVCSGQESETSKEILGQENMVVVPGIRPEWAIVKQDDQSRITTPTQAIQNGADLIVVGRPIRDAKDPKEAADRIVGEIDEAQATGMNE